MKPFLSLLSPPRALGVSARVPLGGSLRVVARVVDIGLTDVVCQAEFKGPNQRRGFTQLQWDGEFGWHADIPMTQIGDWLIRVAAWHAGDDHPSRCVDLSPTGDTRALSDWRRFRVEAGISAFGSWYEFFPRAFDVSAGSPLRSAAEHLSYVAGMGFDGVYLPPIHPVGETNRKGPRNSPVAAGSDPGSPWAIGSRVGGHTTVDPALGTLTDFREFVVKAVELGLCVALDLSVQCSPDHPWVVSRPQWFRRNALGQLMIVENPPKKYGDLVAIDFDSAGTDLLDEVVQIIDFWASHGVRVFRVDVPQLKPYNFWQEIITKCQSIRPELLFMAEAHIGLPRLEGMSQVGFSMFYSNASLSDEPDSLEYWFGREIVHQDTLPFPIFWTSTHDGQPAFLNEAGLAAFRARSALGALGWNSWGMLAGYELGENEMREDIPWEFEHADKYEIVHRDYTASWSLSGFIHGLNSLRTDLKGLFTRGTRSLRLVDNLLLLTRCDESPGLLAIMPLAGTSNLSFRFDLTLLDMVGDDLVDTATGHSPCEGNLYQSSFNAQVMHKILLRTDLYSSLRPLTKDLLRQR